MKILLKLILSSLVVFVVACSDDDRDSNTFIDEDIIGKWRFVDYKITEISKVINDSGESNCEYRAIGVNFDYVIDIAEEPKKITGLGSYIVENTLICDGELVYKIEDNIIANDGQQSGFHLGEWKLENGRLITSFIELEGTPEIIHVSPIIRLTNDELVLTWETERETVMDINTEGAAIEVFERDIQFRYIRVN